MLIFGHKDIESENFYRTSSISKISQTPPNSTIFLNFSVSNILIMKFAKQNNVHFAVEVSSIKEALLSESLEAKYIISDLALTSKIQEIADNYMFDSKILSWVENDDDLETLAIHKVDGAIFRDTVKGEYSE